MALHCPATVHLVGRDGLPEAVRLLGDQRIAVVCVGPDPELSPAAESAARSLGVTVRLVPGLEDAAGRRDVLAVLADEYRGEHALVVVPGHHRLVTLEIGDDGVRRVD